jgi:predicted PurR-regulated permease PerM
MFLALAIPVSIVLYKISTQVAAVSQKGIQNTEAYDKIMLFKTGVVGWANKALESVGLDDRIDAGVMSEDGIGRAGNMALKLATGFLSNIPSFLLSLFVFCAALYYFLAEDRTIKQTFLNQGLLSTSEANRLIGLLKKCCQSTVVSSVLIAVMQASLVGIGCLIFSGGDFFIVWVVTFFCSFIPVIGAGPVALSLAIYKGVLGEYGSAIGFTVVAVIAGTADNLVRPYLVSAAQEDLHPVVSLLAIIGALVIFGMPGLFLGPVIATVAIKIIPTLYKDSGVESASKT